MPFFRNRPGPVLVHLHGLEHLFSRTNRLHMLNTQRHVLLLILTGLFLVSVNSATASVGKSGNAAISVGGKIIRQDKIDTIVDLMARAQATNGELGEGQRQKMEKLVATNLIGQELLELEAKSAHIEAKPAEIDSMWRGFKKRFPDEASFKKALRAAGDNEAQLKGKLARQIRADKVLAAHVKKPQLPSDKEMKDFWEKHKTEFPTNDSLRALQIILLVDGKTSPEVADEKQRKLTSVRVALDKDSMPTTVLLQRFMSAAAQISEGPEAKTGGDLQRFNPKDFNADFRKQVQSLRVGQMSPVFKTGLGFHLVMLIEKYDGKYESYKLQILQNLVNQKTAIAGGEMRQVLKALAAKYPVKFLNPKYKDSSESGLY